MQADNEVSFEIEWSGILQNRGAFVTARLLTSDASFTLTDHASLGGCAIRPWTDIPRVLDGEGKQRLDVFAFHLVNEADVSRLMPGAKVLLKP
jgi:hypothetical protein